MAEPSVEEIPLEKLAIDLINPRHPNQPSQREAIHIIARSQGLKLYKLAKDIVEKGLNPTDLIMVTPADEHGMHTVLEGNRRVAALKLLVSPELLRSMGLRSSLEGQFHTLQQRARQDGSIPSSVRCAVVPREEATHWIQLKHTGENEGVGIVPWDGIAADRFRGRSPALTAVQLVENSNYLDAETKKNLNTIPITTVGRLLTTPEARRAIGVDVRNGELSIVAPNQEEALARLAMVVRDVANGVINVNDIEKKEDRIAYAHKVAATPLPTPVGTGTGTGASTGSAAPAQSGTPRRINPNRKTLIPRDCFLRIHQTRINKIYHELQQLNVTEYVNSSAVMLRVFVEQSVDHYAQQKHIPLTVTPQPRPGRPPSPPYEMKLREKIRTVANYMEQNKVCDRNQLQGVRALIDHRGHVLSVDSLNGYVHNQDYSPTASDLRANWDSIQAFVEALWRP